MVKRYYRGQPQYKWSRGAFTTFDIDWDDYESRQFRYLIASHFYTNTIFSEHNPLYNLIRRRFGLYKFVRGVYNPVERIVEGYVSFIYGGAVDYTSMERGAIPLTFLDNKLAQPIRTLFIKSGMNVLKSTYARNAAIFADSFLKVVDDIENKEVRLEILDPRKVEEIELDKSGKIKRIYISYIMEEKDESGVHSVEYTYGEEITDSTISTFKNGQPFAYPDNPNGAQSWSHPYGFVPVTHGKFKDIGRVFAYNSFHGQMTKIAEICDMLSLTDDNLRNSVEQIYHAKGIPKGTLDTNRDEVTRDTIRIIYTQTGDLIPIAKNIPFDSAVSIISKLEAELNNDLPVLALHTLRDMSQVSAVAVRAAFSDAIARLKEAQSNLDSALEDAITMALYIMNLRGYGPPITLDPAERGFFIKDREVINDGLTNLEIVTLLNQYNPDNPTYRIMLEQMGISEEDIIMVEETAQQKQQADIQKALLFSVMQQGRNPDNMGNALRSGTAELAPDETNTQNIPSAEVLNEDG